MRRPLTTSRTAWARRKTRASLVCFKNVSKVGRASSGKCSLRVRMRVVSRINYYKNISTPRHPTWLPYYRSTAFPTQIFQDLLIILPVPAMFRTTFSQHAALVCRTWPWHLLTMLRQTLKTEAINPLVDACFRTYPNGLVTNVQKGQVPSESQSVARYVAKYVVSPPISVRRIERCEGE